MYKKFSIVIINLILLNGMIYAQNKTITTSSGLKYTITQSNPNGEQIKVGDKVKVHYTGKLLDGKIFDSSVERNDPFTFTVGAGEVIQGWDEGLALLRVGEKATLTLPANIGYGNQAVGSIPANSTLIFDIEVLEVIKPIPFTPYSCEGKDTIKTTSGIKYMIVEMGDTSMPSTNYTQAYMHYAGYLLNSTMFDNSFKTGEPFQLPVRGARVIKGWQELVLLMNKGMKIRAIIPSQLAYGNRAMGNVIPANSDLVFDMYLQDLK